MVWQLRFEGFTCLFLCWSQLSRNCWRELENVLQWAQPCSILSSWRCQSSPTTCCPSQQVAWGVKINFWNICLNICVKISPNGPDFVEFLCFIYCSNDGRVTANTIPGFIRNSAPLWAKCQDAFRIILGPRVQAQPVTLWFIRQRLWRPLRWWPRQDIIVGKLTHGCGCERMHHVVWWGKL